MSAAESPRDVMSSTTRMLLLYVLPGTAIYVSGNFGDPGTAAIVWPLAFLIMGVACVANARRCSRVHCYFTGPLFLLASALSAVHGWNLIDLGTRAWEVIGYGTFALAFVLYFAPEAVWGKYFRTNA